jgi:zinc transporter 11
MIGEIRGVYGALLGTFFTWAVTALGSAVVFAVPRSWSLKRQRLLLEFSFGFAAGIMLAASFWSLLQPAIELAQSSSIYGAFG